MNKLQRVPQEFTRGERKGPWGGIPNTLLTSTEGIKNRVSDLSPHAETQEA